MSGFAALLDEKLLRLLRVLYAQKDTLFHLTKLAADANVPASTAMRLLKQLTDSGLVSIHPVGKIRIYAYKETEENDALMRMLL